MGYTKALEAAGATVYDWKQFGSYQGTWIAEVALPNGRQGLIKGYYGSCSGCDAFEAEFSYDIHDYQDHTDGTGRYESEFVPGCTKCQEHFEKLKYFGERYFSDLQTAEEMAADILKNASNYVSSYDEEIEQAQFVYVHLDDKESSVAVKLKAYIDKGYGD